MWLGLRRGLLFCYSSSLDDFLDDLAIDTRWLYGNYGASILIGFTGKTLNDGDGCISHIPTSGGTHPLIVIGNQTPDMARVVMHEVSHAYGLTHIE